MSANDSTHIVQDESHLAQSPEIEPGKVKNRGGKGRRKIDIKFIEDKTRRQITFSKRKAGLMKKAYELSTLTGTQILVLVTSETGHVYTFATKKFQPFITDKKGKNLIQQCLTTPDILEQGELEDNEPIEDQDNQVPDDKDKKDMIGNQMFDFQNYGANINPVMTRNVPNPNYQMYSQMHNAQHIPNQYFPSMAMQQGRQGQHMQHPGYYDQSPKESS